MNSPFISTRSALSRRTFLRGTGVALTLPFLDAMLPPFARAATAGSPLAPGAKPRRMFGICNNLGLLGDQAVDDSAGPRMLGRAADRTRIARRQLALAAD